MITTPVTLNGKLLVENGIITEVPDINVQQHGVDLNVISIEKVSITHKWGYGRIYSDLGGVDRKTKLPHVETLPLSKDSNGINYWYVVPGYYCVKFAQGCDIPEDMMLIVRQRSSMLRCGTVIYSSLFDAGFKTDSITSPGMHVSIPIEIEYNARIAQIYGHKCTPVKNLYDGQYQKT